MLRPVILCASELRSELRYDPYGDPGQTWSSGAPDIRALVALAADAEFDGIALGGHAALGDLPPLVTVATAARLTVPVVAAPLGEGRLVRGRRLPVLATLDDDDERRAALALFRRVVEAAVPLGIRLFTLNLGAAAAEAALAPGLSAAAVARHFARRELEDDQAGVAPWERLLGRRRDWSGRAYDACRYALDRVAPLAEHHGVTVALEVGAGPWGLPTPREAGDLLVAYREAPLRFVWDDARMQALHALGLAPSSARLEALAAATVIRRAHQAVGIETGYLPGLGDPAPEAPALPATAEPEITIVMGRTDSSTDEAARARDLFGRPGRSRDQNPESAE